MLYAHDGTGIGHLVRTCNIARELLLRRPEAQVVVACGLAQLGQLAPKGCRSLELPAVPARVEENAARRSRGLAKLARRELLLREIAALRPNVTLVDHRPLGKHRELRDALPKLKACGDVVLGYRRLGEDPGVRRWIFEFGEHANLYGDVYAEVFVYAPAWLEARHPRIRLRCPVRHVGFVGRRGEAGNLRRELEIPENEPMLVCGFGGGGGAWPLARKVARAWKATPNARGVLVLCCGPRMSVLPAEIDELLPDSRLRVLIGETRFANLAAESSAVVATAGYNTIVEVLRCGRPLWLLPNQASETEQDDNVRVAEELGLAHRVEPSNLRGALLEASKADGTWRQLEPDAFDGARRAADRLLEIAERRWNRTGECA